MKSTLIFPAIIWLLDCLDAAPESHPLANEEGMKRMRDLKETIDLDDNNYIIIGKWKR